MTEQKTGIWHNGQWDTNWITINGEIKTEDLSLVGIQRNGMECFLEDLLLLADKAESLESEVSRYKAALEQIQTCIKNGSLPTQFMDLIIINGIATQALEKEEKKNSNGNYL